MKFKRILTCKTTIAKKKLYSIKDFGTDEFEDHIKKAKSSIFDDSYRFKDRSIEYVIYYKENKLRIRILHSFDEFEAVEETINKDIKRMVQKNIDSL